MAQQSPEADAPSQWEHGLVGKPASWGAEDLSLTHDLLRIQDELSSARASAVRDADEIARLRHALRTTRLELESLLQQSARARRERDEVRQNRDALHKEARHWREMFIQLSRELAGVHTVLQRVQEERAATLVAYQNRVEQVRTLEQQMQSLGTAPRR